MYMFVPFRLLTELSYWKSTLFYMVSYLLPNFNMDIGYNDKLIKTYWLSSLWLKYSYIYWNLKTLKLMS